MQEEFEGSIAGLTTLGVGGYAHRIITVTTQDELVEAVHSTSARLEPVLIVAGGSNVVVSDAAFPGTVIHVATRGIEVVDDSSCGGVSLRIQAGEPWDDVVARAVAEGWVGIEALSGIPGSTGATPIQNVGAYGQEVASVIASVRTLDRHDGSITTFAAAECGFGYRTSRFKHSDRWVVLEVELQLPNGSLSEPVGYTELARALGVDVGVRAPLLEVRNAVLQLRRAKGMVVDPSDPDSRSVGSFFTNPLLTPDQADALPDEAPRWPTDDGRVKTSAAWLIERAGFDKGYGKGPVGLSTKHTLAIVNRGNGTAADVVELSEEIRETVLTKFGVDLLVEPTFVGIHPVQGRTIEQPETADVIDARRQLARRRALATTGILVGFVAVIANIAVTGGGSRESGFGPPTAAIALAGLGTAAAALVAAMASRRRLRRATRGDKPESGAPLWGDAN